MSLFETLQNATSEEGVKDAYIQALKLKDVQKDLVDIRTTDLWFEAKHKPTSVYVMFTQLLHYVFDAVKKGEAIPPFLCVIDTTKAALMKTSDVLPLFNEKNIRWNASASKFDPQTLQQVSTFIGTHFVQFNIATHEHEFIDTLKQAIQSGEIIRSQITPDNLKQVFDKWVELIGRELAGVGEADYALLFFADIMHDGKTATHHDLPAQLLHDGERPVFVLNGAMYKLHNTEGYRQFWLIYHKPPSSEYRNYLLERRDSLIPLDERSFKGAYYTPLHVVDKAYDLLAQTLGKNWQSKYIVWDMCCGVGNLEVKHSNHRNLFMSTLDQADLDLMRANKTCVQATKFQYDYLNDDIDDFGKLDYRLSNKLPSSLREVIAEGKNILVLINPPYAEATNANNTADTSSENKIGVANTQLARTAMASYGKASNELYTQFLVRIAQEIPNATIAIFSTLKYVSAPTLDVFRDGWYAKYLDGFAVHSKAFDGITGHFPIGFLIWKTQQTSRRPRQVNHVQVNVLDQYANPVGDKVFYKHQDNNLLTDWVVRPASNKQEAIPLKNAVVAATATKDLRGLRWSDNAIAWFNCAGNDVQNASRLTMLFSSGFGSARGLFVTEDNLWQVAIIFAVRRLIKPTWLNDRDQFLQATEPLTTEFKHDCLVWMLFNGSNLSASANDLSWRGELWSIVNHFIPFTETELGAPSRFESDFMVQYLKGKKLSAEAAAVMAQGKQLWQTYFKHTDTHTTRETLKLNRADVGWYQVRKALETRNQQGMGVPTDFAPFKTAYEQLSDKLRPQVYELGFMKL